MKKPLVIKTTSGPLDLEFLGHSDPAAFDLEAGFPNAAMHYANLYHVHRDTIEIFAEKFTPFLEKFSGIPRGIDEKITAKRKAQAVNPSKVSPVPERFVPYLLKVCAKATKEQMKTIQAEALAVSRSIHIDVAPAERKTMPEVMYYTRADSILACDLDTINEKVSKFLALVPDFLLDRDENEKPTRDSFARLLQKYDAARWAQED